MLVLGGSPPTALRAGKRRTKPNRLRGFGNRKTVANRHNAMKILVFAKPGAKRPGVEEMENIIPGFDACLNVRVAEPAAEGRANEAVCRALAKHFRVPVSSVRIAAGRASRQKVIII